MKQSREKLIQRLFENTSTIKRGMYGHPRLPGHKFPVSRAQLDLLFTIRQLQPVSFSQISKQMYMTPGAVSQFAEGLEQHQLITRRTDPEDRRKQYLETSKKGAKLLLSVEKQRRSLMESITQDLSDEELVVWLRIQEKVIKQFQAETDK